jgi:glycosyltransferase involved in cell wall biosynthesis
MEAMAMELPCVATWITGIPEIIEKDVEGLLVPPASASAIADAVERLMEDPQGARRLGIAARRKVIAKYHLGRKVEGSPRNFAHGSRLDLRPRQMNSSSSSGSGCTSNRS